MLNLSNIDLARQYRTTEDELRETKSYIYQLVEEVDFRLGQLYGDPDTSLSDGLVDIAKKVTLDYVHPVGEIFISVDETFDPNKTWGGTWERLTDKFLVGAGDTYALGATGGEATHTLTMEEMPNHNHGEKSLSGYLYAYAWSDGSSGGIVARKTGAKNMTMSGGSSIGHIVYTVNATHTHNANGNGVAHNNLPPYEAVYMWKRIA